MPPGRVAIRVGEITEVEMSDDKSRVLLILPQDVLDRARVLAGKETSALKLPVSVQIVLRSLIEEGLKRDGHPALRANVEGQARAVRDKRRTARRDPGGRRPTGRK